MGEGNLYLWIKKDGQYVESGEVIAEIETDKATMEFESADEGILKIVVPEGSSNVKVNTLIALLLQEGEQLNQDQVNDLKQEKSFSDEKNENQQQNDVISSNSNQNSDISNKKEETSENDFSRVFISPVAKKIAENENVCTSNIPGTGPRG